MPCTKQMEACFKGRKHQIEIKLKRGKEKKGQKCGEKRQNENGRCVISYYNISKLKTIILIEMMILLQTNCIWKKQ